MKPFKVALAERVLGLTKDILLPKIAEDALVEGYDSLNLGALAGMTVQEFNAFTAIDLYKKALQELNLMEPKYTEAIYVVMYYYIKGIATSELSALEGVTNIKELADIIMRDYPSKKFVGDGLGIEAFIGLYYEITDLDTCQAQYVEPNASKEDLFAHYEKEIVREAQVFEVDRLKAYLFESQS